MYGQGDKTMSVKFTKGFGAYEPSSPPVENLEAAEGRKGYEAGLVVRLPEFLEMVRDIWESGFCGPILDGVDDWESGIEPFAIRWHGEQPQRPWHDEAGRDMAHDYLGYEEKYRHDEAALLFPEEYDDEPECYHLSTHTGSSFLEWCNECGERV